MKPVPFDRIAPREVRVGDLILCRAHDDQWEQATARVVGREDIDAEPGDYEFLTGTPQAFVMRYEYRLRLLCRHVNLRRLDATGGPVFAWHRFSWNGVMRYRMGRVAESRLVGEARGGNEP